MKRHRFSRGLLLMAILTCACMADAQSRRDSLNAPGETSFWAGAAFGATTAFGGMTAHEAQRRSLFVAAIRHSFPILRRPSFTLRYTLDAIPIALTTGVIRHRATAGQPERRGTVAGGGFSPIGFEARYWEHRSVQPFVNIAGAILYFASPVPLPESGRVGFIGETGGGLRFSRRGHSTYAGLKFHHISNGRLKPTNRGMNTFLWYVGWSDR